MNRHMASMEQLFQEFPVDQDVDPTVGLIAACPPNLLNNSISYPIEQHETNMELLQDAQKDQSWAVERIIDYGQRMQTMSRDQAETLQSIQDQYTSKGLTPTAELLDHLFKAADKANTSPEFLGADLYPNKYLLHSSTDRVNKIEDRLLELKDEYRAGKDVRAKRNQLGRPAKVAAWVGGMVLSASLAVGMTYTLSETPSHQKNSKSVNEVVGASAGVMTLATGALVTSAAANNARNKGAKRRAQKITSRS